MLYRAVFSQDVMPAELFGDPRYLELPGGAFSYSRFNVDFWIRQMTTSFRRSFPYVIALYVFLGSFLLFLLTLLSWKRKDRRGFPNYLWLGDVLLIFLVLFTLEIVSLRWLAELIPTTYLEQVIIVFDVLWWLIPAICIHLAIVRFIWTPLHERTGYYIPIIVRRAITLIVYGVASFGIMNFVFGKQMAGLAATSGIFAVLIGFASKVDISNIFAGIGISVSKIIRINDWVKIADFEEGQVVEMTSRATNVQTRGGHILSIPNTTVAGAAVQNFSYPDDSYWLDFTLETVPLYPPDDVKKILLDGALAVKDVLSNPPPLILFKGQGDSSAIYTVKFGVRDYGKKPAHLSHVWNSVWRHLEHANIELATPCRFIYRFDGEDIPERKRADALDILQSIPIFEPFSAEVKEEISQHMWLSHVLPGTLIIQQGAPGDSLWVIVEGTVSICIHGEGDQSIEVARRGAGEILGEMALLTGEARTASVIAVTDTYLYEITRENIAPYLRQQPQTAAQMGKMLAARKMELQESKDAHRKQQEEEMLYTQLRDSIQRFFGIK